MAINSKEMKAAAAAGVLGAVLVTQKHELTFYHYEIVNPNIPKEFDGYKILHLSDLHKKTYGNKGEYLVYTCEDLSPDVIMFSGDLFSRNESIFALKNKVPMMSGLNKIAPLYYVWGNHEVEVPDKAKLLSSRLSEEGITVLRNEKIRLYKGNSYINLYGLELPRMFYRNDDGTYDDLPRVTNEEISKRLGRAEENKYNILLTHMPMPFKEYAEWGADLTLAGHVHGGIIRIGNIGLLSPERKFFPKYSKGLYHIKTHRGHSQMEVSAGLGKFRLNNPQMISLCILRRKSEHDK